MPNSKRVLEALISRHNKRLRNLAAMPTAAVEPAISVLLSMGYIDPALRKLGVTGDRHPSMPSFSWIDQLSWGIDSIYASARLLFAGQITGATVILRSQFERWAENAAYNMAMSHEPGESASRYIARAWASCHEHYPFTPRVMRENPRGSAEPKLGSVSESDPDPRGPFVLLGPGHQAYPAELMDSMSELLHGRGPWMDIVHWEVGRLLDTPPPSALAECSQRLAEVATLNSRQLRLCLATLAEEQGLITLPPSILSASLEGSHGVDVAPNPISLYPLSPNNGLGPDIVGELMQAADAHEAVMRGKRPAGRLYRDDEFAHLLFYERRARAARWALKAFEFEEERMGALDFDRLGAREFRYVVTTEMAGLVAVWLKGTPAADAAASCSSAIRTAYWLWLEDDDRAMGALRVVLEQCARLRVWMVKPEKAEQLEDSKTTSPKDWINAAGWRRLSALTRALGEFSHAHSSVHWDGARDILEKLTDDGLEPDDAFYMARGSALDAVALLLTSECVASARVVSPVVGEAFAQIVSDFVMDEESIVESKEELFKRTLSQKNASLGGYTFAGPADKLRRVRTDQA